MIHPNSLCCLSCLLSPHLQSAVSYIIAFALRPCISTSLPSKSASPSCQPFLKDRMPSHLSHASPGFLLLPQLYHRSYLTLAACSLATVKAAHKFNYILPMSCEVRQQSVITYIPENRDQLHSHACPGVVPLLMKALGLGWEVSDSARQLLVAMISVDLSMSANLARMQGHLHVSKMLDLRPTSDDNDRSGRAAALPQLAQRSTR